jgi:hypothetical protein
MIWIIAEPPSGRDGVDKKLKDELQPANHDVHFLAPFSKRKATHLVAALIVRLK